MYDQDTIRVYQAYSAAIADSALSHGRFVEPPFKMARMTWIKPSFLWMMYRSGWAKKDEGQHRILAIDICRSGFEWALTHACLSHPEPGVSKSDWEAIKSSNPVRIQWDPERDLHLQALPHRAIQIGLTGAAVHLYANEWITAIKDVTGLAHTICDLVQDGQLSQAQALLPQEMPYPVDGALFARVAG